VEAITNKNKLSSRITFLNLGILIVVLTVIVLLLVGAMTNITDDASARIAHLHAQESVGRFMSHLDSNLVLLRKTANSPAVQQWFADEHNEDKKYAALIDLQSMAPFLQVPEFYMGVAGSLNEYIVDLSTTVDDFTLHGTMSDYEPMDRWFFNMMETDRMYTFNVDIDKATHTWNIWLLYRVIHEGQDVGLLCIPFRIDQVLDDVFGEYDDDYITGYFVDGYGFIQIESVAFYHYAMWEDESIHISTIDAGLGDFVHNFAILDDMYFAEYAEIEVIRLTDGYHDFAAIAPIPHSTWMIVTVFDSRMLFALEELLPMVLILVSALIIFALVSMIAMRQGVFKPISNLMDSVSKVTSSESTKSLKVYGYDRTDEIGDLSRTIQSMLTDVREAATKEQELLQRVYEEQKRIEVAEEGSKAKSAFLAKMSHEIRTPISAVLGISEIGLSLPDISREAEETFAKIYNSGKLLLGIINDILDFSRIEEGKMLISPTTYDTASLISNAANLHYAYVGDKDIKFNLYVDENIPAQLIGDTLRIEQVILNVLSNAFKYTDSGAVDLRLQCRPLTDDDIMLIITISDTGLGMSKEQVSVLFEAYRRFHEQEMSTVSGTGLGMHIVSNLISLMDAKIDVESTKNVGTTVTIHIPQKIVSKDVLGREGAQRLQRLEVLTDISGSRRKFTPDYMPYGKILVVDDIEANLFVAQGLLAFYSLSVDTCTSGQEAIDKVKKGAVYDIIFMDHMMPGMDGVEAMKLLRKTGYTHPIVILTANALVGQEEEYIKSGFDSFLSKPIMTENLNAILIEYVKNKQLPEVLEVAEKNKPVNKNADGSLQDIDDYKQDVYVLGHLRTDFVKNHKNAFAEIAHALDAKDIETAQILAHTLKGLAGLIHESLLAQTAAHIESLLAQGKTPSGEDLSDLEQQLSQVIEGIGKPAAVIFPGLDNDRAKMIFDRLYPSLETNNADCLKAVDELRKMPEMAVLARQIEDFEFEQAVKTVDTMRKILDI